MSFVPPLSAFLVADRSGNKDEDGDDYNDKGEHASLVGNGQFTGHDLTRAGQHTFAGEQSASEQNSDEDYEFQGIGRARVRQHEPEYPHHWLSEAYGPHGPVEKP